MITHLACRDPDHSKPFTRIFLKTAGRILFVLHLHTVGKWVQLKTHAAVGRGKKKTLRQRVTLMLVLNVKVRA